MAHRLALPVQPPVVPMLAELARDLPEGDGWLDEPKWDGFRALVFWDGGELFIQSRDLKPLNRYFPERPWTSPSVGQPWSDSCLRQWAL
jgi:ATP-dependent DNA ligase